MNHLTKPADTRNGPLVKDPVKTGLTVDVSECRPELLPLLTVNNCIKVRL
jgi:hypothetical protein